MTASVTPVFLQIVIMLLAFPVALSIIEILKGNMYYWTPLFILLSAFLSLIWFYPEFVNNVSDTGLTNDR